MNIRHILARGSISGQRGLLPLSGALLMGVLAGCASQEATNQMTSDDGRGCVPVTRIDETEVLDESTILFTMTGGDIYRNTLPQRCPQLDNRDAYMYRIPTTQLCRSDVITVLQRTGPTTTSLGFTPTASCALGSFEPISQEEADTLREAR